MKANTLSVSIPVGNGKKLVCNKRCPYCVSKMTGVNPRNDLVFYRNLKTKAKHMAMLAQINSVILTGKSELLLNMEAVYEACEVFSDYPLEIQTNGLLLTDELIEDLATRGVNTLAVSIDSYEGMLQFAKWANAAHEQGVTLRATVNLTNEIMGGSPENSDYKAIANAVITKLQEVGVDQVSFRKLTVPDNPVKTLESITTQKWIEENAYGDWADVFLTKFDEVLRESGVLVNVLPFGARVYMYNGISCTTFGHCIQEKTNGEDIRSLVYYEDGHMSVSWYGSNFGRVF